MLGIVIVMAYYSAVNCSFYSKDPYLEQLVVTQFLNLLAATWQYYSLVDLAEVAEVL